MIIWDGEKFVNVEDKSNVTRCYEIRDYGTHYVVKNRSNKSFTHVPKNKVGDKIIESLLENQCFAKVGSLNVTFQNSYIVYRYNDFVTSIKIGIKGRKSDTFELEGEILCAADNDIGYVRYNDSIIHRARTINELEEGIRRLRDKLIEGIKKFTKENTLLVPWENYDPVADETGLKFIVNVDRHEVYVYDTTLLAKPLTDNEVKVFKKKASTPEEVVEIVKNEKPERKYSGYPASDPMNLFNLYAKKVLQYLGFKDGTMRLLEGVVVQNGFSGKVEIKTERSVFETYLRFDGKKISGKVVPFVRGEYTYVSEIKNGKKNYLFPVAKNGDTVEMTVKKTGDEMKYTIETPSMEVILKFRDNRFTSARVSTSSKEVLFDSKAKFTEFVKDMDIAINFGLF